MEQVPSAREHEHEAQRVPRVLGERSQRQRGAALARRTNQDRPAAHLHLPHQQEGLPCPS